ncbi:uncharacterized protein Bfra_001147 [Botrytis fragariae]|uniref:Uncharacterized protein n=1 Tax=Botrytis fragariae TaxID=1964551 RepID=A0A8H6B4C7_9HELO|nr:uncharacterized protein Bfra_001147 [Botrytis fragariae]KAF5878974.1 hypothetical protein Bfra_001147 [Botrytis fragariae]
MSAFQARRLSRQIFSEKVNIWKHPQKNLHLLSLASKPGVVCPDGFSLTLYSSPSLFSGQPLIINSHTC